MRSRRYFGIFLLLGVALLLMSLSFSFAPASLKKEPADGVPAAPQALSEPEFTPGGLASQGTSASQGSTSAAAEDPHEALRLIRPKKATPAKPFTVQTPTGGTLRLSDLRGKIVMVNFWATWCPPCLEEMPAMQRLYDRFKADGFVVVALSVDTQRGEVTAFVKEHTLTFPVGLDPKMQVAEAYSVRALPSTFFIDSQGRTVAMALGPREWDGPHAQALIRNLLASRKA
jgi:peroxiredoxin